MIVAYATLVILSVLSIVGWLIYLSFDKRTSTTTVIHLEPMHTANEKVIMSTDSIKQHHRYVSENQYQAWFRKTFLKPRRKR